MTSPASLSRGCADVSNGVSSCTDTKLSVGSYIELMDPRSMPLEGFPPAAIDRAPEPTPATRKRPGRGTKSGKSKRKLDLNMVFDLELEVFKRTCRMINTPRSLACHMLAEAGEWTQYLELSFPDPARPTFADDYLVTEMLSKNPRLPLKVDRKAVAIQRFADSEEACADTNKRFPLTIRSPPSITASCTGFPRFQLSLVIRSVRSLDVGWKYWTTIFGSVQVAHLVFVVQMY